MGPLEDMKPWSMQNINGIARFLNKVWELSRQVKGDKLNVENAELEILLHKMIKKVGEDIDMMSFNTAISAMMMLANAMQETKDFSQASFDKFLVILSPFAPHLAEELWSQLGHQDSILKEAWPAYDPAKIIDSEIELPVQVNGKVRAKLVLPADVSEAEAVKAALDNPAVQKYVMTEPKKMLYVKGRMISIVV